MPCHESKIGLAAAAGARGDVPGPEPGGIQLAMHDTDTGPADRAAVLMQLVQYRAELAGGQPNGPVHCRYDDGKVKQRV